jgi:hypothetical protein
VTQNLSQQTSNHRSGRLTRSVRRAGGFVQVGLWEAISALGIDFGIGARRGLPLREIEVISSVIIATLLCI